MRKELAEAIPAGSTQQMMTLGGKTYRMGYCSEQSPKILCFSLKNKTPIPWDHHRALGIVLLQRPRGALFLASEVPL